jgi:D-lactate dehydrogenase
MKIKFFETSLEKEAEYRSYFEGKEDITFYKNKLEESNISHAEDADIIHIFVNSVLNREILEKLPNLKMVVTGSTGYDHIDIDYCKERNIKVTYVPAYGSNTVAEFTFALLLTLSRNIYQAYKGIREKTEFSLANLRGFDLCGKTIGVVGTGKIGKNVMKYCLTLILLPCMHH